MRLGWFLEQTNNNVVDTFKNESRKYGLDQDKIDKTLDAVLKQKQIFYLTLISHQFKIMEDGSIELSMEYIASAETESNNPISANVLRLDSEVEKQIKELNERLKMVDKRSTEVKLNNLEMGSLDRASNYGRRQAAFGDYLQTKEETIPDLILENEELDKEREDIAKQLESIPRQYRINRFKSITEKLLNCGLIRAICKTKEDMINFVNLRYASVQTVADIRDIVKTIEAITKANSQVVAPETFINAFDDINKNNEENNDEDIVSGQVKTLSQKDGKLCPDINGKQINFFYLRRLDGCCFG